MTLTEFLLARITEDEAAARADIESDAWGNPYGDGTDIALTFTADRVLAECEAKRQIVELHSEYRMSIRGSVEKDERGCDTCDEPWPCDTLRALALPYADHPDYREEWRP